MLQRPTLFRRISCQFPTEEQILYLQNSSVHPTSFSGIPTTFTLCVDLGHLQHVLGAACSSVPDQCPAQRSLSPSRGLERVIFFFLSFFKQILTVESAMPCNNTAVSNCTHAKLRKKALCLATKSHGAFLGKQNHFGFLPALVSTSFPTRAASSRLAPKDKVSRL